MKAIHHLVAGLISLHCAVPMARAHIIGDEAHDHARADYDFSVQPPTRIVIRRADDLRGVVLLAAADPKQSLPAGAGNAKESPGPTVAKAFAAFSPKVKTRVDGQFLYVESDGMPAHEMMTGITAWQQQVPLPQPYTGNNAWRIPLQPVPAKTPASIKGRFLRGAIALAANGIPIFNPQNNRGEISQEIGELDQWGGHCGRADDYHYHAAPLHLQVTLGKSLPIAYALDGYPMYGLTEPDGSAPANLDAFNGHETAALGYHYHGSTKYPYVNGGFHGEVTEREGQVDPQPRAQSMREAGTPLRGARITGFTAKDNKSFNLQYEISGEKRAIRYVLNDDKSVRFDYVDGRGQVKTETYSAQQRGPGGGGQRPPGDPKGKGGQKKGPPGAGGPRPAATETAGVASLVLQPKRSGNLVLHSAAVAEGGALPVEFNGDGAGISPPLDWQGAPAGTKSFALVMDHLAPGNEMKCYWTVWDIPANVTSLPTNSKNIGKLGPGFKGALGYEAPHSQGPGLKHYTIHLYALSASPQFGNPREVTREVLLTAIKDSILDSADLNVTYTRPGGAEQPRRPDSNEKKGTNR